MLNARLLLDAWMGHCHSNTIKNLVNPRNKDTPNTEINRIVKIASIIALFKISIVNSLPTTIKNILIWKKVVILLYSNIGKNLKIPFANAPDQLFLDIWR